MAVGTALKILIEHLSQLVHMTNAYLTLCGTVSPPDCLTKFGSFQKMHLPIPETFLHQEGEPTIN